MDSDIALGSLIHERLFGAREKKREAEAERVKNEASEATTLRKLMSLYDPERKDHFTSMDLPNLRGEVMAFTGKQRQMKEAKDAMTAQALNDLLAEFNQPGAGSTGDYLGEASGGPARPLNAANLRSALPRHAAAAQHPNLPDLLRILQTGDAQGEEGVPTIGFSEDPETGTRFATYGNVLQPSGVNPKRAGRAVAITSPTGEELGVGLPGRSGVTPLQTGSVKDKDRYERYSKQLNTLIASQGKAAYNKTAFEAYQTQIDDLLAKMQALEGVSRERGEGGEGGAPTAGTKTNAPAAKPVAGRYKLVNGALQLVK